MKVLVIGGGGREHALAWKLAQSPRVTKIYSAPGNPGTALVGDNVSLAAEDILGLRDFALAEGIDFTVVGPELPLTLGIVDEFTKAGLKIFGPDKLAAKLEGSKVFSKDLMVKYGIPTGHFKKFTEPDTARDYINTHEPPFVVKADGLAAGKGVIICRSKLEAIEAVGVIMEDKAFGLAGKKIIIEEFLTGEEASYIAVTDGKTVVAFAPSQDHKAIFEGDRGPNTGGMGAYSPTPVVTPELEEEIMETIMRPTVLAMKAEGRPYRGVLYAGLMISGGKPKVLEFNCRFGDPECQPLMMRLETDLLDVLLASSEGTLEDTKLKFTDRASVCVVMASRGYPGSYDKGHEIKGLDNAEAGGDVVVFHAGTEEKDGKVVTSGGRVLGVTGLGDGIKDAIERTYEAVDKIQWEGAYFRRDIGRKALEKKVGEDLEEPRGLGG